jgi:hypothetical protein
MLARNRSVGGRVSRERLAFWKPFGSFAEAAPFTRAEGTFFFSRSLRVCQCLRVWHSPRENTMNGLIYLIGLIVVIMIVLSLLGLR